MKTKLFGTALLIAALCSFGVSAQESCAKAKDATATCCKKVDKDGKDCKAACKGDSVKKDCCKKARPQHPDFFRGITLTADQQAKIDALHAQCGKCPDAKAEKADCSQADKSAKCEKAAKCDKPVKADCCKADTTKCCKNGKAQCNKKGRGHHDGKGMRRPAHFDKKKHAEYVSKVKEILTPEQYTIFLENMVSAMPQCKDAKACKGEGKCPKGDKADCCKGDKPAKCDKACKGDKPCPKTDAK